MTTGRINQVTIAGRGPSRASPVRRRTETTEKLPHRSASTAGTEGPRSRTVKRPTLAKPRTRVTNGGAATGSQASRRPLRRSRPPQGRRKRRGTDSSLAREAMQPPPHRQPARDAERPPLVLAQRLNQNCRASQAMPQPENGPAHSTPAGRSAEQRLPSIHISRTDHSALRHSNRTQRLDCAPHIVVSEP